jgi:hypothetical protein
VTPGADDDETNSPRSAPPPTSERDRRCGGCRRPARKWTDADLGALCNQAAVKLGDPAPIKAMIAEHVPEGQVPHSRNIPEDQRERSPRPSRSRRGSRSRANPHSRRGAGSA